MPRAKRGLVGELRSACDTLRAALVDGGVATAAEVAEIWPGSATNPGRTVRAWIETKCQLTRLCDRIQREGEHDGDEEANRYIARRSTDEPIAVTLTSGDRVHVHPKSYTTLRFLDFLDRQYRYAAQLAANSAAYEIAEDLAVHATYPLAESFAVQVWVWVITTPGCELPFDPNADTPLEPPALTRRLKADDLVHLYLGHERVNRHELAVIAQAFPADPRSSRLKLEGFLNAYAYDAGRAPLDIFARTSLGSVFANSVAVAQSAREARAAAQPQPRGDQFPGGM